MCPGRVIAATQAKAIVYRLCMVGWSYRSYYHINNGLQASVFVVLGFHNSGPLWQNCTSDHPLAPLPSHLPRYALLRFISGSTGSGGCLIVIDIQGIDCKC